VDVTGNQCIARIKSELKNLKAIAEYRHQNGLPVTPDWMRQPQDEQAG
jgi:hypothetical protein